MKFEFEIQIASAPGRPCQDCAKAKHLDNMVVCALADGVGGMGGGGEAAQWVVAQWLPECGDTVETLLSLDERLSRQRHGGQTTAVLLRVGTSGIEGASVGDSCAWLLTNSGEWLELTEGQRRKPFLGSGEAFPVGFAAPLPEHGRLLLASDGLWRHAAMNIVFRLAQGSDLRSAASQLLECARLPISKQYADDVSLILVGWGDQPGAPYFSN